MTPVDFSSLRPSPLRFDSLRLSPLHSDSLRSVAPGGSHPFQDERATGVSPLLGVGRTRRRDTLVPLVSSDRRDCPQGLTNDPFPAVSPETRQNGGDLFPISHLFGSEGTLVVFPAFDRLSPVVIVTQTMDLN